MLRNELPLPRAFRALMELADSQGDRTSGAITFALTWLAAARMVLARQVQTDLAALASHSGWLAVEQAGLPLQGTMRWVVTSEATTSASLLLAGQTIVQRLVRELGSKPWDVLPILTATMMASKEGAEGMVNASVAELTLDMLGAPAHRTLWIPFDRWGALTVRALRRGWRVNAAPMLDWEAETLPLLLAIDLGRAQCELVDTEIERDADGRPLTRAACVLACPPFGMTVRSSMSLMQWDSSRGESFERYARSETWVVNELLTRTSETAVFLLPPGVLFTRGQEQRLREHLVHLGGECNALHSIVTLPGGAFSQTGLSSALVMVTPRHDNLETLMVDLGLARRSTTNLDELVQSHRKVALGLQKDPERACRIRREEILRNEVSLVPSRYLRPSVSVGQHALPLQELCEAVRAPTIAREDHTDELLELGIPELGNWAPVTQYDLSKLVKVKGRRGLPALQPGDLVLSIKGTIGKAALVGPVDPVTGVVSQSCLGLRLRSEHRERLSPEYLLMYFRSEAGQAQLESLQAGTTIQHVSPQTLLSSFLVPLPDAATLQAVETDYRRLCQLEEDREHLQQQMHRLVHGRWQR